MKVEEKLLNLVEFYLNSDDEPIEDISRELEAAGIDPENSEQKVLDLIKKSKVDLKIESGKKFKNEFYALLADIKEKLNLNNLNEPELATAFRKLEENGAADLLDDKEKMLLLEFIKKKSEE